MQEVNSRIAIKAGLPVGDCPIRCADAPGDHWAPMHYHAGRGRHNSGVRSARDNHVAGDPCHAIAVYCPAGHSRSDALGDHWTAMHYRAGRGRHNPGVRSARDNNVAGDPCHAIAVYCSTGHSRPGAPCHDY